MKQHIIITSIFLGLIAFAAACEKSSGSTNYLDQADCTGINTADNTYTKSIKSILDTQCATADCHAGLFPASSIDLSTYAKAKSAFQNTQCLCSIHHGSECKPMPENGTKLSDAIIKKIDCWAKNGYAE